MASWFAFNALALVIALGLDGLFGEPDWLWKRMPHPVVVIGRLIARLDAAWNQPGASDAHRKHKGLIALLVVLGCVGGLTVALVVLAYSLHPLAGFVLTVLVGAVFLAQRSLHDHVAAVASPLVQEDLPAARTALSMIVGRKTDSLDQSAIARAALESLAENHSDGVVAPAFWMLMGGAPGIALYKAINTADSMVGYKTPRHRQFGWAAARLDDSVNWVPARLCVGLIMAAVAMVSLANAKRFAWPSWRVIRQDAPTHASPNAGWPEASYACALDVALGGPRAYPDHTVDAPYINADGRRQLTGRDIEAGLALFRAACATTGLIILGVAGLSAL